MDTALLHCFLTLCETQSFSAAAQRLNLTQSTVSQQIGRLEAQLQAQLFLRTTRRCELTREGRELVPLAGRILRGVEEMEERFRPRQIQGRVVIGVPDDYYLFARMTEALKGFLAQRPNVAVEMRAGLAVDHDRALREGTLDLAVFREVGPPAPDALVSEPLVWIAAEGWRMPSDGILPLALIGGGGGCRYRAAAVEALDHHHLPWKCQVSCTSLEGVLSVVRAGLAVSVVPLGESQPGLAALRTEERLPALPPASLRIRHAEREPSLAARALSRTLAETLTAAEHGP